MELGLRGFKVIIGVQIEINYTASRIVGFDGLFPFLKGKLNLVFHITDIGKLRLEKPLRRADVAAEPETGLNVAKATLFRPAPDKQIAHLLSRESSLLFAQPLLELPTAGRIGDQFILA